MAKFNYQQARKQKELARKTRQQEKQAHRSARPTVPGEQAEAPMQKPGDPREASPENGT